MTRPTPSLPRLRAAAAAALCAALAAGCGDDFITETPAGTVTPENFYRSSADALAAVNTVYAGFINLPSPFGNSDYLGRNLWMLVEYPTETVTSRLSAANERSLIGNYNPQFSSSHPYLISVWQAAYAGINRANAVIARVPAVPMDTVRRAQIVGEAKFLRALHYYWLAGLFGGVPLKLEETTAIDAPVPARATAADTYAQIAKDLTEAAAVLPAGWPNTDNGRATRGAALALLGKAYLQSAATGASADAAGDYQKALDALRTVSTLGYTLDANYASLFDGTNEQSREIIFSFQNTRVAGLGGTMTQWFAPVTNPSLTLFIAQNQFQAERPFYDSYNAADVRKAGTWLTSFSNAGKTVTWAWTSGIQTSANYGSTGPVPRKYLDLGASATNAEAPDFVILRYGDVRLSMAEAINAVSGPTSEALTLVNEIRGRAKVPNLRTGLTQAQFRDSLFAERRFELAMENHGVFDSRRNWPWAKARVEANMAVIRTANASPFTSSVEKADTRPIADKWRLYPIPLQACQLNPQLVQNPGWSDGVCK